MKNSERMIIGVAAGLVAGAAIGLLLAPKAGKELRDEIAEQGRRFTDGVKEKWNEGKEKINAYREKEKTPDFS